MPHIAAFRGHRYDLGHVGALDGIVAPAKELIDGSLQSELYKRHPSNVVRLIHNREELGDESNHRFDRAGRFFRNWQREGVLQREPDPAVYVCHTVFDYQGRTYTRRGFVCRTRLEDNGQVAVMGSVSNEDVDYHLRLLKSCEASLSPTHCLYFDEDDKVQQLLEEPIANVVPIEATDVFDATHRLWPVTDIHVINNIASAMAQKQTHLVEGAARYRAALAYQRDEVDSTTDPLIGANYVLTAFFNAFDSGFPTFDLDDVFKLSEGRKLSADREAGFAPTPAMPSGLVFYSHDA